MPTRMQRMNNPLLHSERASDAFERMMVDPGTYVCEAPYCFYVGTRGAMLFQPEPDEEAEFYCPVHMEVMWESYEEEKKHGEA